MGTYWKNIIREKCIYYENLKIQVKENDILPESILNKLSLTKKHAPFEKK